MAKGSSDERVALVLTRFEARCLEVALDEVLGFRDLAAAVFVGNGGRRGLAAALRVRAKLAEKLGRSAVGGA